MSLEVKSIDSESDYQSFWDSHNLHALQSWYWGEVKVPEGWEVQRLGVYKDGQLIWVVQLQSKEVSMLKFAYIPKAEFGTNDAAELVEAVDNYYKTNKQIDFLIWEFNYNSAASLSLPPSLQPYSDHIQPQQTNQVSLGKTEAELSAGLKGNYRRNIKKAEREGLEVEIVTNGVTAVDDFYLIMEELYANTKFLPRTKSYFEKLWQELSIKNLAKIFLAKHNGQVAGAYLVIYDNLGAYELYGGVSKAGRDLEAGYLLKWEAIKDANNSGKKIYDHWGCAPKLPGGEYDKKDELYNISLFKEGFGGKYLEFSKPKVEIFNILGFKIFAGIKSSSKFLNMLRKLR